MKKVLMILTIAILVVGVLAGCQSNKGNSGNLKGAVKIDGSSTVLPISEAIGEEFQKENPDVRVTVGESGTGGGFEKFASSEIDIADASRLIKDEEKAATDKAGIEYIDLEVGYDGLSVVVNKDNDFIKSLSVDQLKEIWEPKSNVKTWKDINPSWPAEKIKLYGPGTASGTFDYFTKEIVGEEGASRPDYTASEDDNVLVQGVSQDKNGLGYFGYAYYEENKDKLKLVAIDNGKGAVIPSKKTIQDGTYAPLSRPLFIYINKKSLKKPEVEAFVKYYLDNVNEMIEDVGYVKAPSRSVDENDSKLKEALGS